MSRAFWNPDSSQPERALAAGLARPAEYSYFVYRRTISHFQLIRSYASSFQDGELCRSRRISEKIYALHQQHAVALH
jgi:hypothetical protein